MRSLLAISRTEHPSCLSSRAESTLSLDVFLPLTKPTKHIAVGTSQRPICPNLIRRFDLKWPQQSCRLLIRNLIGKRLNESENPLPCPILMEDKDSRTCSSDKNITVPRGPAKPCTYSCAVLLRSWATTYQPRPSKIVSASTTDQSCSARGLEDVAC